MTNGKSVNNSIPRPGSPPPPTPEATVPILSLPPTIKYRLVLATKTLQPHQWDILAGGKGLATAILDYLGLRA